MPTTNHLINHLPLVTFEYPDSATNRMSRRHVRVTAANGTYVEGFEFVGEALFDAHGTSDSSKGKFKRFSRSRLPLFGVALVEFVK